MTSPNGYFDMTDAPMRIGTVRLKVRDLPRVSDFYQSTLGLVPLDREAAAVTLGTGATPLLHLDGDPRFAPVDPRQAGLYHTAFLMPTRADLGRWLGHVAQSGVRLQGASDHLVSEALYLADPEGNGIEVYADRPVRAWRGGDGEIRMSTDPLDLQDLLRAGGDAEWSGFPQAGSIGHVHLQVGDTAAADGFYKSILGFDIASRYPGASFYGSGGYHHQLAGNTWHSRNAGIRPEGTAGLAGLELILRDPADREAILAQAAAAGIAPEGSTLRDPWGTAISLA